MVIDKFNDEILKSFDQLWFPMEMTTGEVWADYVKNQKAKNWDFLLTALTKVREDERNRIREVVKDDDDARDTLEEILSELKDN